MIIHISGPIRSGKTTLGLKILNELKNKIILYDLDNLLSNYIKINKLKHLKGEEYIRIDYNKYKKYIDSIILNKKKPIILVGINAIMNANYELTCYNIQADYKYFINIDNNIITKQRCQRFLEKAYYNTNSMTLNNKAFVQGIKNKVDINCNSREILNDKKSITKFYNKLKYKIMKPDMIYKRIINDIKKN